MPLTKSRLSTAMMSAVLPATDLERARMFYRDVLGIEIDDQPALRGFMGHSGQGTQFLVYETMASHGDATSAAWLVDDIEATMAELRVRGVVFEEYDMPGLKTVNGLADMGPAGKSAWFKDSEGNTLNIAQM
jgi:predicted enzyme related to lactoylglutathione lyase